MKRKLIIAAAFIGVFVLGVLAGGVSVFGLGRNVLDRRAVDLASQQQWRKLADELDMTPEQRKEARVIIVRGTRERVAAQRQVQQINGRMEKELGELLTAKQKERYKEIRARSHQAERLWQKWLRDQRKVRPEPPLEKESDREPAGSGKP